MSAPLRTAADRLLRRDVGCGLDDFVLLRRANGATWQQIADDLSRWTGGVITATAQSIRVWYADEAEAA